MAEELGISLSTSVRIRQEDKGNLPEPSGGGRPSKVSDRTKRLLARKFDSGAFTWIDEGQELVESIVGRHVHEDTVRSYLEEQGLKCYIKQKKPDLTSDHIKARHAFAARWMDKDVEWWRNVMFSDETVICRLQPSGKQYYYQRPGNRKERRGQIVTAKKGGGGKMLLWGCVTNEGVGDLSWIPGTINSEKYVDVLQSYVLQSWDYYGLDRRKLIFQHDNASVHTAQVVKNFLNKSNIDVLEWPPNSPDLNIIEHVWAHVNRELDRYKERPTDMDELWERVQDIWTHIPLEFIQELYRSIPRRVEQLYRRRGKHTDY